MNIKKILLYSVLVIGLLIFAIAVYSTLAGIAKNSKLERMQKEVVELSDKIADSFFGIPFQNDVTYKSVEKTVYGDIEAELGNYYKESDFPVYIEGIIEAHESALENQVDGMSADDVEVDLNADGINHVDLDSGDFESPELGVSQELLQSYLVSKEKIREDSNGRFILYSDLTFIDGEALFEYKDTQLTIPRAEVPYLQSELSSLKGYNFVKNGVHLNDDMVAVQYISTTHTLNIKWIIEGTRVTSMYLEVNNN